MKKIAIIGAGIAGIATAYQLLKKNHNVTIFDARSSAAMEGSYANGAQLSVSNAETWNTPGNLVNGLKWMFKKDAPLLLNPTPSLQKYKWLIGFFLSTINGEHRNNTLKTIELAKKAREIYFQIADEENIEFDLLKKGILRFYDSKKSFKEDANKASWMQQDGLEWDVISSDEVFSLEPALANNPKLNIVGGIYTKSDASGDIHKFCVNLQKVLVEKYFANIELNTLVTNISKSNDKIIVTIKNDDNENDMSFDNVVVCAGVNTQTFADNLGDSMNIYPVKGYSVTIDLKDEQSKKYAPIISLIDQPLKIVSSRLGNKLRIAGTAEISGYDPKVNIERIQPLLAWVNNYFPNIKIEDYSSWGGFRPMSSNMMPVLSESKVKGVFYHSGHGHLGWTLSAATAEIIADKI